MDSIKTSPGTMMEVFKMLPEGTLAEIIEDSIFMSPAPTPGHQLLLGKLYDAILQFIKRSKASSVILFAPVDVYLDEHSNAVQPDLIFISEKHADMVKKDAIHGVPDLLIEILSAGNADHDRVRKKDLYEKFGVSEYWIINPETKETMGFALHDGKYQSLGSDVGRIHSVLLDNTSFGF